MAKNGDLLASRQSRAAGRPLAQIDFEKRARAKFLTMAYVGPLSEIEDSTCRAGYVNTLSCAETVRVHDGKATSHYCKNRWCLVCNRIRTAVLVNEYLPQLQALDRPYHLVLTNTNCRLHDLKDQVARFNDVWRKIYRKGKRAKLQFVGLKKFECTYNVSADTYHPHFHFCLNGREVCEYVLHHWLDAWRFSFWPADAVANKFFAIDKQAGFLEFFKYFTKVVSKVKGAGSNDVSAGIFIEPLNQIMQAMKGRRVFEPLGIKKVADENAAFDELAPVDVADWLENSYSFNWYNNDWFNGVEMLSGYQPTQQMLELTNKILY